MDPKYSVIKGLHCIWQIKKLRKAICKLWQFITICYLLSSLYAYSVISHAFLSSADFFFKSTFQKKNQEHYQSVKHQARCLVGSDLDQNHLQRLSADNTSLQRVKPFFLTDVHSHVHEFIF